MSAQIGMLIAHYCNDFIAQPLAKVTIFRGVVVHQRGVGRGFVDHHCWLIDAIAQEREGSSLVGVELTKSVGFEMAAKQAA